MISNLTVTLIVSGSIAAYKSAELTRELVKRGGKVHVVLTKSGAEFITPMTLQTLSGHKTAMDMFAEDREAEIGHIKLADSANAVLCAPATANLIAKAAAGIADDLASTILLATKAPVIFAPAMNVNMWLNPVTQRNVALLKELGCHFVEPDRGELACGWEGPGRFPEIAKIVDCLNYAVSSKELQGAKVTVTAGPTRESMDPIRFLSNRSTGKMGFALARTARGLGASVTLIAGPTSLKPPYDVHFVPVNTAEEMREAVMNSVMEPQHEHDGRMPQYLFMAAAVSDHRPASASSRKLKYDKSKGYELSMEPCPDILQILGDTRQQIEHASGRPLVLTGFAAETGDAEELLLSARDKLNKKKVDLIVGNFADDSFEKDTNRVWLLDREGRQEEIATADKHFVAARIIRAALRCQ